MYFFLLILFQKLLLTVGFWLPVVPLNRVVGVMFRGLRPRAYGSEV